MGIFERYLTLWVGLCILAGVLLGNAAPGVFELMARLEYADVNLVVALFIWIMIYPLWYRSTSAPSGTWARSPGDWS